MSEDELTQRRRRRATPNTSSTVPTSPASAFVPPTAGPWCPSCQYEHGTATGVRNLAVVEQAMTMLAFGRPYACEGCGLVAVPVLEFEDKPRPGKYVPPVILPTVGKIIESVFNVDYAADWKALQDKLTIGSIEGRQNRSTVTAALDVAEDNARKAHRLWCNVKVEYERYKLDVRITRAAMRNSAHDALQQEKKDGSRSKQITDEDVASKMAELFPDDYKSVEMKEIEFKLTVEHAENFSERWNQRANDLRSILNSMRGTGGE